jgi:flagellar protein FlbD
MIQLTRLNHHPLVLNSSLIKVMERSPDTVITLVTGEKLLEKPEEVLQKIVEFRRSILRGLNPWTEPSLPASAGFSSEADV